MDEFLDPNWLLFGQGNSGKTVLGSNHVVEQLLFSIFPSILTFDFYLNLGSFFLFVALMGYFWGWGRAQKLFWGSWTICIFYGSFNSDIWFWLNFGVIFYFWDPNGLILGLGRLQKNILGSTHVVEQLSFSLFASILTFDFDLILGHFLLFGTLMGYFWGWRGAQKLFWGLLM